MASSSDLAAKAKEAFIDDHFELAVDYYSQAIALHPHSSHLFSDRSQANIKLNNFTEAVADASKAIELDSSNAKAYLRKGTACFSLEEYQIAKAAFEAGSKLAPEDARFTDWIKKCEKCIAEEDGELPTQSSDVAPTNVVASSQATEKTDATSEVIAPTPAKPKYRHEFYQKPEEVVVTIFAKGIPANSVFVNYGEQILSVTIDVPGEDSYIFQPRLFGKIVPAKCRHVVLSTKVEIRLAKAEVIQWTSLEFGEKSLVAQPINVSTGNQRPTYPSSRPTKDWDKLEAQVKKEEKDEKLDGDAALNKFFRDIYKDADEDTRRAMRKSFALHVPQMMVGRPPTNSEAGTKLYISNLDNEVTNEGMKIGRVKGSFMTPSKPTSSTHMPKPTPLRRPKPKHPLKSSSRPLPFTTSHMHKPTTTSHKPIRFHIPKHSHIPIPKPTPHTMSKQPPSKLKSTSKPLPFTTSKPQPDEYHQKECSSILNILNNGINRVVLAIEGRYRTLDGSNVTYSRSENIDRKKAELLDYIQRAKTQEELQKLPRIGRAKAADILKIKKLKSPGKPVDFNDLRPVMTGKLVITICNLAKDDLFR